MKLRSTYSKGKAGGPLVLLIVLLVVSVALVIISRFKDVHLTFQNYPGIQVKKLEILSQMQINLFKSVEAEKMAVTADTDESSKAFAAQSQQKSDAVERDRQEFGLLLKKAPLDQEIDLLREFDRSWKEFRAIDREILEFAVKNTNIKAAKLSFKKGGEAVRKFEEALDGLISSQSSGQGELQIERLISKARVAGIKIQYLHAPHIAEANDKEMDKIEREIKQHQEIITKTLNQLTLLIPKTNQGSLQKAGKAFNELCEVTAQVIDLSRQNTNIKSFELSLGRKRKITAQCDEILRSLEETVRSRSFKATR